MLLANFPTHASQWRIQRGAMLSFHSVLRKFGQNIRWGSPLLELYPTGLAKPRPTTENDAYFLCSFVDL